MKEALWCFTWENYRQGTNYGHREKSNDDKCRCKIIVKPENPHFENKKITTVEIDDIKENVRPSKCKDTEYHTKE
jgi:hypothetical protein